jgi:cullin-associated NEDD8-dissociated protein 1
LSANFQELNQALTYFVNEMVAQNLWDDVTLVMVSDFARTLTANSGEGSDHAWGGNYFVMGGAVKGGQIHGRYPEDLTESGPYNIGRGRLLPTLSWESVLNSVVQMMGIETEEELDYCLPNRHQTGTKLFTKEEVFL